MNFLRQLALQEKENLVTTHVLMLLKSRVSLHVSEPVSFLVGLRTYQHHGTSGRSVVLATFPV